MRLRVSAAILAAVAVAGCSSPASDTPADQVSDAPRVIYVTRSAEDPHGYLAVARVDGSRTAVVPTPRNRAIEDPDASPDGRAVIYTIDDMQLWTTTLSAPDAKPQRVPVAGGWGCARWMPDGKHVLATADDGSLAIVTIASGAATTVHAPAELAALSCGDPAPDGSHVAVGAGSDNSTNQIWALDLKGGAAREVGAIPPGCIINRPAWSPDGKQIAVDAICEEPENNGIWLVPASGGSTRKLVGQNPSGTPKGNAALQYWDPTWLPGGDELDFYRVAPTVTPAAVWTVQVGTGDSRQVIAPFSSSPSIAPARSG